MWGWFSFREHYWGCSIYICIHVEQCNLIFYHVLRIFPGFHFSHLLLFHGPSFSLSTIFSNQLCWFLDWNENLRSHLFSFISIKFSSGATIQYWYSERLDFNVLPFFPPFLPVCNSSQIWKSLNRLYYVT